MKRLKGWKMCAFLGLSAVIVAAVFMLQVDTMAPIAPDGCVEPCGDETPMTAATTATELPAGAMPGPLFEPLEPVRAGPVTTPEGPPMGPVEAQHPVFSDVGVDVSSPATSRAANAAEDDVWLDDGAAPAEEDECVPGWTSIEFETVADGPARDEHEVEATAGASAVDPFEVCPGAAEQTVTQEEGNLEAAHRGATAVEAAEAPETVKTEVEQANVPESAEAAAPVEPQLLPFRLKVPEPRGGIPVTRRALGYRVPLVVKQRVPAQIHGGVYMPAHETYVVLRPGYWKLDATAESAAAQIGEPTDTPQAVKGCWLGRLFWKPGRCDGGP